MLDLLLEKYPEYTIIQKPESDFIAKYKETLPEKILQLWSNYGFGNYMNGYLKVVNPEEYESTLLDSYNPVYKSSTVLFATGMGDLIVWENDYLVLINYRYNKSKAIESGFNYFLDDLLDNESLEEDLLWKPFEEARERLGPLAYDECYGYVPLLALGGAEKAENMQKVKIKEHIAIISQLAGKI
ncbi:DUF1851 domain-containing protein [Aquimarina sp. AD10]|uniref:T6SS immunity protein Tdi1 domain-containing protein n=1 Tax=Aquimarina sp. AD10 TaxID=1714849 RepID=UPI000E4E11A6|nr:T6SS immunity protein Tdi1 domain-containing protein [Aquimarina sp. AD10]AXT60392.1 DUF1851 domain-containing protein [Aquimarina sp. AD10]RKN01173.1 DUF1851 domain-containing protein [Aquimarina sp. AD10]